MLDIDGQDKSGMLIIRQPLPNVPDLLNHWSKLVALVTLSRV